ncbi:vWA domain-containing protein [Steroidobacter sp.]|uniref:vWA domain-containing protein n=1 Tax=Steroidobacter sp. TaxID=1978227 RepID=UPI001A6071DC|nr:VWA domain-containing protein [Steroidobacter sp.]MBL8265251.1 VWA domain-containing protein [Steroidobacter sp.]
MTSAARQLTASRQRGGERVHWVRTLVAKGPEIFRREHLRFRPGVARTRTLHCLLVDCSASMLQSQQLAAAKGMLMQLIQMAYDQQADIAIVGFAGAEARVFVAPTRARPPTSIHAERWLQPIRGGGATPLSRGVATASRLISQAKQAQPQQHTWLWLLTDGRTTESPARPSAADNIVVVDCERSRIRLQHCLTLARRWSAQYLNLQDRNFTKAADTARNANG